MKRRRKLVLSTSISVYLSLNVHAQKDNGTTNLLTIPLLSLTTLLLWWWNLQTITGYIGWHIAYAVARIRGQIEIWRRIIFTALALCEIGVRSIIYGAGLTI